MSDIIQGFQPVFDAQSRLLILGSFPSVKSRQIDFYYGNKQNRFWKMLFGYFGEPLKESTADKKEFLHRKGIALWDIVTSCEIVGSSDASIRNAVTADIRSVLEQTNISLILLNGTTAFRLFEKRFSDCGVPYLLMPSTSPANTRCDLSVWYSALDRLYIAENNEG